MANKDFTHLALARQFASYKWARNNTLQILKAAQEAGVMDFTPHKDQHAVLYQFQCLVTTDDAYYRKLTNSPDQRFGVAIRDGATIAKEAIPEPNLNTWLEQDLKRLEMLLMHFTSEQFEANAQAIQSIINHEYLHQGQLVVMFRQAGVALPQRFKEAFDL